MYKVDLPVDRKESAAIERRRIQEEQRKSRIFDAKTRLIGIDKQALEQQMKDRQYMEEREKMRSDAFARDAIRNDMIAEALDHRQDRDRRELNKTLNEFRDLHQKPESRREFDLYDPDSKKKDKPARVSDQDPRLTVSGMQVFEGEDLNRKARSKFQAEQSREWAAQQARERKQAEQNQKKANELYDLKMRELEQRAIEMQIAEDECRRAIDKATADYNKALAAEQDAQRAVKKQQEDDDNKTEMANHIFGDYLTENPAQAVSAFGAHRVVPDRWKGMSPEQLADIKRTQELQMKEKNRQKEEEKRAKEEFDRQRVAQARAGELLERERERREKEMVKQQAEENLRLMMEQKRHQDYMDKEVYTNEPTAAYFMQFNTTTR